MYSKKKKKKNITKTYFFLYYLMGNCNEIDWHGRVECIILCV